MSGTAPEEQTEADSSSLGPDHMTVEIPAHRVILATCCPYFYAMFTGDMSESRQNRVYIQGIVPKALQLIVDYMYSAEIHITEDNVQVSIEILD